MPFDASEALGIGITVALIDGVKETAEHVVQSFKRMAQELGHSAHEINELFDGFEKSFAGMAIGTAIIGPIIALGNHAVEEAEKVDLLHDSVSSLAEDSGELADKLDKAAQASGLFQGEQFMAAGKNLLAMGIEAENVEGILKASAQAAAVLGRDVGGVTQVFNRIHQMAESGMPVTIRMFRSLGLTAGDLIAQGLSVQKGKVVGSFEEIAAGVEAAIDARHGKRAAELAKSAGALKVQIGEAIQSGMLEAAHAGLKEAEESILESILERLRKYAPEIGAAFGGGFNTFLKILAPVGHALEFIADKMGEFIKEHPAIARFAVTFALLAGAAIFTAGAIGMIGAAMEVLPIIFEYASKVFVDGMEAIGASMDAVPMLLGLAALAFIIYEAWDKNFGGLRDTITRWFESTKMVVEALVDLFGSGENGVGQIPVELQNKLIDNGLWPIVQEIYIWGNRLLDVFSGVWEGIKIGVAIATAIFHPFIAAIGYVLDAGASLIGLYDDVYGKAATMAVGTESASNTFKDAGEVIGVLVGLYAGYQAALIVGSIWTGIVTALTWGSTAAMWAYHAVVGVVRGVMALYNLVQAEGAIEAIGHAVALGALSVATWAASSATVAFTVALLANPLTWIVIGVLAVVAAIALLVKHFDSVRLAFYETKAALKSGLGMDHSETDATIENIKAEMASKRAESVATAGPAGSASPGASPDSPPGGVPNGEAVAEGVGSDSSKKSGVFKTMMDDLAGGDAGGSAGGGAAPAGAAAASSRQAIVVNLHLSGRQIHQAMVDEEGNAQERTGSA